MASSSNKRGTRDVFNWSDDETISLCDVCLAYIKGNGKMQFFKWSKIQSDVEKKIGREFTNPNSCKNKYDAMRKDWRMWRALRYSETGLGYDPYSGTIKATDDWWQKKIKENSNYKKFRQKGVSKELEDKWDLLFGDSYATGENVYVPSMDPIEDLTVDNENVEEENAYNDGVETIFPSNQFDNPLFNDDTFCENFVEQARSSDYMGTESLGGNSQSSYKLINNEIRASRNIQKQPQTRHNNVQMKRTRRQSTGSAMLAKGIAEMTECVKFMSQSSTSNVNTPSPMSTISTAMQYISRMVDTCCLEKHSDLWFYATTVIEDATKRDVFLSIEDDESRAKWLEYSYNKKDK